MSTALLPIPDIQRDKNDPPPCDLGPLEFRAFAQLARWGDRDVDLILKTTPGYKPWCGPFLCGGRFVTLLMKPPSE